MLEDKADIIYKKSQINTTNTTQKDSCNKVRKLILPKNNPLMKFAKNNPLVNKNSNSVSNKPQSYEDQIIFIVKNFNMQRQGIGLAPDMTGHHRHRPEFAHRAGTAKDNAIEQPPFDIRQGNLPKNPPAAGSHKRRCFFLLPPLRFHHRHNAAGDKGQSHKDGCQHNPRHRKHHCHLISLQGVIERA